MDLMELESEKLPEPSVSLEGKAETYLLMEYLK